uniref:Uncharacterized protein n=1 Tax=Anguilla anguilla TaxID=7936 RepID=A0A0E9T8B4_ANGAN
MDNWKLRCILRFNFVYDGVICR